MANLAVSRTSTSASQSSPEKTAPPDTKSLAYIEMETMWQMLRTVMAGTEAMRQAATEYLPLFPAETKAAYALRLERTVLTNLFEDAVRQAASLPFKKPVQVNDETPGWLRDISEDIDLGGNDISQFSRKVLEDGIIAGYSFIFIDYTRTDGTKAAENLAQEKAANARPYWVHIRADDMLAIYINRVNGHDVVTHCRFREIVNVRTGFEEVAVEQIRVLEPGQYWVYQKQQGEWKVVESGAMSVPDVPVVCVMCGREATSRFVVKPLFLDLCYKQIEHWQSSSDQRNILTFARFPVLAVAGAGTNEDGSAALPEGIGPNKMLATTDPQGKWYYVEPTGKAIESGQKDLDTLVEEMRILGLQPTVGTPGSVTATARALDEARVHSAVQVLALNLEGALNEALEKTLKWRADSGTASVYVNRDFGISLRDSREIDALLRSRVAGELSRLTFWNELKRRNVLSVDFDADEETAQLEKEEQLGITIPGVLPPENKGLTQYQKEQAALGKAGPITQGGGEPETTQGGP